MQEPEMPCGEHLDRGLPVRSLQSTLYPGLAAVMLLVPALAVAQTTDTAQRTDRGTEKNSLSH
jgi:hypothetical protein